MKTIISFLFILLLGLAANGQGYQSEENDLGVDIVSITAFESNLRELPTPSSKLLTTYTKDTRLILLSRDENSGWYKVSNIYSLQKGWLHKSTIELYLSGSKTSCINQANSSKQDSPPPLPPVRSNSATPSNQESPFSTEYVGGNKQPTIVVQNDSDRLLTFTVGGLKYTVSPGEASTINLTEGSYNYEATAPRTIPDTGTARFNKNYRYTWRFYIVTRRVK